MTFSWDSTAPRRIGSRRATSPQPRPEDALLTAEADLLRGTRTSCAPGRSDSILTGSVSRRPASSGPSV